MAHHHLLSGCRWLLLGTLALAAGAHALDVSPLRVQIPATAVQAELWLHNPEDRPWSGQARLYRWEQTEHSDVLVPAQDVAVSPAELRIDASADQRLRVVRLGPAPSGHEHGYRLVLQAGPDSPALRISLPVFLAPAATDTDGPALTAQLQGDAGSSASLLLYNAGARHTRLADLVFVDAAGQRHTLFPGLAGYVLAHRQRRWALPGPAQAYTGGQFRARQDGDAETLLGPEPGQIAPAPGAGL